MNERISGIKYINGLSARPVWHIQQKPADVYISNLTAANRPNLNARTGS